MLPADFFMHHTTNGPLWTDQDSLIFQAVLPFHDGASYLRYTLVSYPLPVAEGLFSKFKLTPDIAIQTKSGHVLLPKQCTGSHPAICHTGLLWARSQFPCERAIINSDESLRTKCLISLTSSPEPKLYRKLTQHTSYFQIIQQLPIRTVKENQGNKFHFRMAFFQ